MKNPFKKMFTKEQAEEEKAYTYGFTLISTEMAESLGLYKSNIHAVAYPRKLIQMLLSGKVKIKVEEY